VAAWTPLTDAELRTRLTGPLPGDGPALVLVDGRSGSGKSTVAERISRLVGAVVVHTDDIAWHHDPLDWDHVLIEGVLAPWRRGEEVAFRPPGWIVHDRPGAVGVPADTRVLVVEGVGAGRALLASGADLVVWVQSDLDEARRRGIERDVALGRTPQEAVAFWDAWMGAEEPFLTADRPWTRAGLIVDGTPPSSGTADLTWVPAG